MDPRAVCTVGGVREVWGVWGREAGAPAAAVDRSTTGRASRESKSGAATTQASSSTSWYARTGRGPGHARTQGDSGGLETGRLGEGGSTPLNGYRSHNEHIAVAKHLSTPPLPPPRPTRICSDIHVRHMHTRTIALTHAHEPKPYCTHVSGAAGRSQARGQQREVVCG